jgi:hypothetical protein
MGLCQERGVVPFTDRDLKLNLLDETKAWKLFFFSVTEQDLIDAAASLPDIGISEKQRNAAVAEIDKKIGEIKAQIEKDLAAEKS